MTRKTLTAGLVGLALSVSGGWAQDTGIPEEPTVTFPAEIEQVTVDVVVVDKKGQPVRDLTLADIEVYEDGKRQTITSFDTFEVAAPPEEPAPAEPGEKPAPPPRPRVSTNTDDDQRQGRTFMIVFDDVHLTPRTAERAKAATRQFVDEETAPGDRVTLVAPGAGVWWNARMPEGREDLVEVLAGLDALYIPDTSRDRMSDYEAMRIHNFRDYEVLNRVERRYAAFQVQTLRDLDPHTREFRNEQDPYITSKAAETYFAATARNHVTLGAIERGIQSLERLQGRKSLILVSEGFIFDVELREFRRIVTASRRANTAIYFLNTRGLEALPMELSADMGLPMPQEDLGYSVFALATEMAGGSESLAQDTGGFTVRNSNDLGDGFKRIGDETRAYYLIGYNPTNTDRDGKFRKIEVKVRGRKGLTVRARRGYYAPSPDGSTVATTEGRDPEFQSALDSPYETDDIPLRMTHYIREETLMGTAKVFLAAEVDLRGLSFEKADGLDVGALEFLLVAIDRRSGEFHRYDQKMDLKLPPETHDLLTRTWLPVVRDFELTSGPYRAKLVVRDKQSERIGTVIHDFEIPDTGDFRVSTPVLSDMRETTAAGAPGDRLALMARREFSPQVSLYCQLDVYRPVKLASTGMPRVTMSYEVRRSDGQLYTREPRSLILPTPEGGLSRIIGFPLEVAPPGDYELKVSVRDELSGKTIDLREPFTVSTAAVVPPASESPGTPPPSPASTTPAETAAPTGR
jgi:VWFA-related protein